MLELRGVTAGYGDFVVLRDVDVSVPRGSVVALIGPNGAGKTTLLRVASGLLQPVRGQVRIDGVDLTGRPPHDFVACGTCHVPEGRAVFPSLTVTENLRLFAPPGEESEARERAVDAFPRLGGRLDQLAGTLSGGEQQMLALARAYVQRPSIILLDEVSIGLAPKIVDEIFAFLDRLRAEDVTLLLVEQYIPKALAISDYVYVLSRGSVIFVGEPTELYQDDVFARYLGGAVPAGSSTP
ncbi:MAG: ABC transporter ATP-binding protein [Acidimicrobiia bacterium]